MKLEYKDLIVCSSEQWVHNFNDFNTIQNSYNLRCSNKQLQYPKSLLKAAWKRFSEIAQTYHLDASKFKYVHITSGGVTWQVSFHVGKDSCNDAGISIYDIYFCTKRRAIMQSCYSMI